MKFNLNHVALAAAQLAAVLALSACGGSGADAASANDASGLDTAESLNVDWKGVDSEAPSIAVNKPGAADEAGLVGLSGTAQDNLRVARVLWTNERGGSGAAVLKRDGKTVQWSVPTIQLKSGSNQIALTAVDMAGRKAATAVTLQRGAAPAPKPAPVPVPAPAPAPSPAAPAKPAPTAQGTWVKLADEFDSFSVSGTKTVRFGAGSSWASKSVTSSGECSRSFFGSDPAEDVLKHCEVWSGSGGVITQPEKPVIEKPIIEKPPIVPKPEEPIPPTGGGGNPVVTSPDPSTTAWPPQVQASTKTSNCASALRGSNRTLNVGPGQTYSELTQVPWLSLTAGDVVNVYYRSTPYRTKFGLRARGTQSQPVVINGVTDSSCNRPEISGDGAVTAADAVATKFWSSIQELGMIQIHRGPSDSDDTYKPEHITIQNLKLTGTHRSNSFTGVDGARHSYDPFASAIYALRVAHLTVENCEITGNNMGIFTNSRGNNPIDFSSYVIVRRNKIHLNGSGRSTEHNMYLQAYRTLVEGNYIGAVAGGEGSSLKDRSSGTVVRYNHIVSGARAIDLVEAEETSAVSSDPLYDTAWVYGNLIVNDVSLPSYSGRMIHWGFDNSPERTRRGTLYFYNNTLINKSRQSQVYYTQVFHMNPEIPSSASIEARSNIFANYGDTEFQFLAEAGRVNMRGTNFMPTGWTRGQPGSPGTLDQTGASPVTGSDPALDSSFVPLASSLAVNRGASIANIGSTSAATGNLQPTFQYSAVAGWVPRKVVGSSMDLGAFERP
jgi:hypothetical protein